MRAIKGAITHHQAPVVQTLDSPIRQINHYHQWISTVFIQLAALGAY